MGQRGSGKAASNEVVTYNIPSGLCIVHYEFKLHQGIVDEIPNFAFCFIY